MSEVIAITTKAPMPFLEQIPVAACKPHDANRVIRDEEVSELADSIRVIGLLHPIAVRPCDGGYQIIVGERRWRAHRLMEAERIPAFVFNGCDDVTADAMRLAENDQRCDPSALDTARELRRIKNNYGLTHEGVAERTAIPLDRVKRYLALFNASDYLLEAFEQHRISVRTALALTRYEKEHGEPATRPVLKKLTEGRITSAEIEGMRRRKSPEKRRDKAERMPWAALEARAEKFIASDPENAKALLARLAKALDQALKAARKATA